MTISSADVILVMKFCSISDGEIFVYNTDDYVMYKNQSGDFIVVSKIKTYESKFENIIDKYKHTIEIDLDNLKKTTKWITDALDGTQRVTFEFSNNKLEFKSRGDNIASIDIEFNDSFHVDLPILMFNNIINNINGDKITFKYGNESFSPLVEINGDKDNGIPTRYFITSMV